MAKEALHAMLSSIAREIEENYCSDIDTGLKNMFMLLLDNFKFVALDFDVDAVIKRTAHSRNLVKKGVKAERECNPDLNARGGGNPRGEGMVRYERRG